MKHSNLEIMNATITKVALLLLSLILISTIGTNKVFAANDLESKLHRDLEYYSYEEYKAKVEQKKLDLQNKIGKKGWNPTDGWYVWTQEKVNETISVYEKILEDIKNGMLMSKPIYEYAHNGCKIAVGGSCWPNGLALKTGSSIGNIPQNSATSMNKYLERKSLIDSKYYSYEEYKTWLEQNKLDLQNIIGEKGWNPTDGWYVWTQEKVNETISKYQQILEDIKSGKLVSKPDYNYAANESIVAKDRPNEININTNTSFGSIVTLKSGKTIKFGPCDSKKALAEEIKKYCEEQVVNNSLIIKEANEILTKYNLSIDS